MTSTRTREPSTKRGATRSRGSSCPTAGAWAAELVASLGGHAALRPEEFAVLRSQLATFGEPPGPPPPPDPSLPVVVRTQEDLQQAAARLSGETVVAIDLETSDLDPGRGEVVGVGLAGAAFTCYVPTGHHLEATDERLPDQLPLTEVVRGLGLDRVNLVAHNAKFELTWLRRHAGIAPRFVWDTMLAGRLLRSDLSAGLKEMAVRELDVPDWGLSKAQLVNIRHLPVECVARYCGKDAWYTLQLMRRQRTCLV